MRAFDYEALDTAGRSRRGTISADTARAARQELKRRQLLPIRLDAADPNKKAASRDIRLGGNRLGHRDLTLLTRQLATLIGAAAPVEEALETVSAQAEKPVVRRLMSAVRTQVSEGHKLSTALAAHPSAFDALYRAMVAAGEQTGQLGAVLERLADHLERSQALRSKVQTALIYPSVLALTAVTVVVILMTFVVPKVVDQFDSLGQSLPFMTTLMIAISQGMRDWGVVALIGVALAALGFRFALRRPNMRLATDGVILRLPLVGRLVRQLNAARLARTLATLVASGTPVLQGLKGAAATVTNSLMRAELKRVVTAVEEGASLSAAMKKSPNFPPMVAYMAAAGERSGRLDDMLTKAAGYMEEQFEAVTAAMLNLLEPGIIIVMGGVVASIVLSILLPILQLNTLAIG